MKLSIIIPVYNEELTIREILRSVQVATKGWEAEIIVVDDGSNDSTREILRQVSEVENIKLVFKPSNEGKGAAVRTGIAQSSGEIVLIQDADLEYDPKDYPALLEPKARTMRITPGALAKVTAKTMFTAEAPNVAMMMM